MSLKTKLEAVIYAAEEPVTLAQLATLFASEAEEWKRAIATPPEQDSEADFGQEQSNLEQSNLTAEPAQTTDPAQLGLEEAVSDSATPEAGDGPPVDKIPDNPLPDPLALTPLDPALTAGEDAQAAVESANADQEFRRLARLREREIRATLRQILDELIADYASDNRGIEIREIAGGFRMATKPECHDAVRAFVKSLKPPLKLSLPALETLAVIAYKQPVTAPEVNEIRGVDSSGVFGSLLARKLIVTAGRKQVIGRPILYKTTREFLLRFGLKDVAELPSMEEFEKMAAIELDEPETSAGEDSDLGSTSDPDPNLSLEFEEEAAEGPSDGPPDAVQETTETQETAETAASTESPTPEEAAPAAPPAIEQAETENSPHGEEKSQSEQ
ncbi:MAG: SMC-Scp complex subunit ScpB [Terracidiphilus sp.]|jgi:segregation and condensation protein B